ncbi:MAG: hypothetical protein AB2392_09905 [Neobacillus sp.]
MWFWIAVCTGTYLIFILFEELIYFFWNRYVYGPKQVLRKKWIRRIVKGYYFTKKYIERNTQQHSSNNEKMSSL